MRKGDSFGGDDSLTESLLVDGVIWSGESKIRAYYLTVRTVCTLGPRTLRLKVSLLVK